MLINNAAANFPVPAEDMSPNAWRTVVDITLNGTFFCAREFARRHLAAGTPGSIVNIGASYAWTGGPGFAHTAAAKAGVKNMVETLAVEWGPYGIQVNGLVPGLFPHEDMTADIKGNLDRTDEKDLAQPALARRAAARARLGGDVPGVAVRAVHLRPHAGGRRRELAAARAHQPAGRDRARPDGQGSLRQLIVDTHVHVVAPDDVRYPLRPSGVGSQWFREHPVSAEEYAATATAAGVDRAVLVQAHGAYGSDNSYVLDAVGGRARAVRERGHRRPGGSGRRPPTCGALAAVPGCRGVRLFGIGPTAPAWFDGRPGAALWGVAAGLDLRVVATLLAPELPRLRVMLTRFPEVPVVLDHCGFPDLRGGPPFRECLLAVRRWPRSPSCT